MDERAALSFLAGQLPHAGDDAAVVDGQVLTTDVLRDETDFPDGTTRYTAGWRAVGAEYVGGDLDESREFAVATTALGRTDEPVLRSGASPGEAVCVTGALGRTGAALRLFERGDLERANELFRFDPRIAAGRAVAPAATAMMDSSDGLARSLHQLAEASDCGFAIESDAVPVADAVESVAADAADRRELSLFFGEDFELVFTVPESELPAVEASSPVPVAAIGRATESGVEMDDEPLPDRGFTHGAD